ncbi:MAG: ribonucleoside-diphosphate reductase subunit alpha [Candidatus Thiodiazotropha sp. (ex Ctena orbiculata)]|uniref:Ribonucleoside-diphosphate reductase n=1 Tax=Candidatus Thiodiazotropha taylori TaxID=2792791 RepID=A0A944MBF1_9GAMM|nr:ribonucleoside-diphosphate reductase subunit alpha [Candidatus Thiodiazotropha taylori]PUB82505.1 MAG: ribonucleoside-diphosphate reductase subunit alpha [gamma proteobacterium symbiont of Ctena orbiculata]MBT2988332.1 ribonucleoside-diphosphate reductase subunit alpha [Candidatus Thiodiazotropha taylori]MBT2997239.1 ribonucleoside-diphosphate reductase subunit alpha [Candidatus Thiodiazotropha taylori]MBT3001051.1 ribonucleoside-diphosphate reductase subunit alpha [Candidatus Thiodiazotroph
MATQAANSDASTPVTHPPMIEEPQAQARSGASSGIQVIRRNGKVTHFDPGKISVAMTKAFLAVEGGSAAASSRIHDTVKMLTDQVVGALTRRLPDNARVHIEDIQDQVELSLMRSGEHKAARSYVLYRERQTQKRLEEEARRAEVEGIPEEHIVNVTLDDGSTHPLDVERMQALVSEACNGLEEVDAGRILQEACRNLFDGVKESDVSQTLVMSARTLIDQEPNYSQVAARLLLDILRREALGFLGLDTPVNTQAEMAESYCSYFKRYIQQAAELDLLDSRLGQYDLDRLIAAIKPERDLGFTYLGLQTLYDRYFIHSEDGVRFELPQAFFMRVAMGLAINEIDRESRAIEFYDLLSSFDFMSSTPTLFNAGTLRPQLSSCYLTTVPDDLDGIYSSIKDNALLSKFAGGLGNDWTRVRGLGAHIKGTNGKSQGVVPFLKVANDTAVAVNQGGKRKGAVCAYLETWHIDIEEFLELRKNTGDERRRTHDMNTANWIPDLFMQRVAEEGNWTLFSPNDTPDLHDLTGKAFEKAYLAYEEKAAKGLLDVSKTVKAVELWRKMLGLLFETGHPWITFKDPCNLRYSNQHMGVVHSSNLCTEITLHTNDQEIAVCNLGSVNLTAHVNESGLDLEKLEKTVTTAMRMLDNVIDYNYYSVPQARHSNLRHRPVGLGIMGFQDALYKQRLAYTSEEALAFADRAMEAVSYYAIQASSDMAAERGRYSSYEGSLWSRGILPIDSLKLLKEQRGDYLQVDESQTLDWDALRDKIKYQGMRNSNTMAIAPTATISNICGVSQSIEPTYQNLFVKSNLSGEFTVVNPYMVHDLKKLGLWDEVMINDLKYYDGSLQPIDRIPAELKAVYATAFEIDPRWLVEAASRRQKWIDQGQSLNLYMAEPSGKKLDNLYKLAWVRGLKTTYYLRSMGATGAEKTSVKQGDEGGGNVDLVGASGSEAPQACSILDPDCEACQ